MSTISVPLTPELELFLEKTMRETGLTRADVMRQALRLYREERAIEKVLKAQAEPSLRGELDALASEVE